MLLHTIQILVLTASLGTLPEVDSTGIFLRIKTDKKTGQVLCQRTIYSRDGMKNACILNNAIIRKSDFSAVSEVSQNSRIKYFFLLLSPDGLTKLQKILATIPDAELILVVNDSLAGIFDHLDQLKTRNIQISGEITSQEVNWIHDELANTLKSK